MTCQFCKGTKKIVGFSSFYDCTECATKPVSEEDIPPAWVAWLGGWYAAYFSYTAGGIWIPVTNNCSTNQMFEIADTVLSPDFSKLRDDETTFMYDWSDSIGRRFRLCRKDWVLTPSFLGLQ